MPIYQFFNKELWSDWEYTECYPGQPELREYFAYVDKKWDLSKDIEFSTEVTGARFDETTRKWVVTLHDGRKAEARWFILAVGFASKNYTPAFPGLDTFKGLKLHTSEWPEGGVDLSGKRVAVIGTGASGVQVIQEIGHEVEHLTVYQRTPNFGIFASILLCVKLIGKFIFSSTSYATEVCAGASRPQEDRLLRRGFQESHGQFFWDGIHFPSPKHVRRYT